MIKKYFEQREQLKDNIREIYQKYKLQIDQIKQYDPRQLIPEDLYELCSIGSLNHHQYCFWRSSNPSINKLYGQVRILGGTYIEITIELK